MTVSVICCWNGPWNTCVCACVWECARLSGYELSLSSWSFVHLKWEVLLGDRSHPACVCVCVCVCHNPAAVCRLALTLIVSLLVKEMVFTCVTGNLLILILSAQKHGIVQICFNVSERISSAHQSCIYLIKNTVKIVKYYCNVNQLFYMWICVKL